MICYVLLLAVLSWFHNQWPGVPQKEKFLFPLLGVQSYQKFPFVKHGVAQNVALSASWNFSFSNFLSSQFIVLCVGVRQR